MFSPARAATLLAAAILVVGACSGSAATPSPVPSAAPSVAPSSAPSATPSATPTVAPSPSPVATIPSAELVTAGKLTICSDVPYPPQEFFDASGSPVGSDIDLGAEIGNRLGLGYTVNNTVFNTIILALQGNKCDIIISAQNITTDRIKQVDMIPYFQAGQSFVVAKGNPKGIKAQDDLCGKSIAAETGTTEVDYLNGVNDYKGQGLTQACTAKSLAAITVKEFDKDSDALLALQAGQVDAYFADSPVAGYYTVQHADQFELSGLTLGVALEGISVQNDPAHKDIEKGVQTALISTINDGTYMTILKKYGDDSGAITADVASTINKLK